MAPNERTEREFQLDLNQAVANTEAEIMDAALGDEEPENDGDTSLEEMGEGLEGGDLEDEEEAEEEGDESEEDDEPESEEAEGEEAEGEEAEEAEAPEDRPQRGRPQVALREERGRRRQAEDEASQLRQQLAEMNGRLTELSARVNAPAPKPEAKVEPKAKPDMFADPEGYERWVMEEAEKRAEAKLDQKLGSFRQEQQQERETFLNANLSETASGPRGFEFQAAYRALTSLPKDAKSHATVARIVRAADPGQAVLDWFEDNGAEEFRSQIAEQLGLAPRQSRNAPRQQPQPARHVTRLPPSLNSARGGGRQQIEDPEMLNDSDESVFSFATKR